MKKLLVLGIAATMLFTSNYSVNAAELVDSVGATQENPYGGTDTTQNKNTAYDEQNVTDSNFTSTSEIKIYATKASKVTYKIPQVVVGSSDGEAVYKVGVKGDLAATQEVSITAPNNFTLSDGERDVEATVSQDKSTWIYTDLTGSSLEDGYSMATGIINYEIPAGSFSVVIFL